MTDEELNQYEGLNKKDEDWLKKHNGFVSQDHVKEVNLSVSPHIISSLIDQSPHTLAELINGSYFDPDALPDMTCLSELEKELIRLTFVENLSTRHIAGITCIDTMVGEKKVSSVNAAQKTIHRALVEAVGKLKLSQMTQNAYSEGM